MNNKNLIIKCLINNSIDSHIYDVKIYNSLNEIILDSCTNKYGCLECSLLCGSLYKVVITTKFLCPCKIIKKIYIRNNCLNKLYFVFSKPFFKIMHPVTIKITDQNYKDLPIMKGKIILWQNI